IAAANLDEAPPEEDALICGDDAEAKRLALELAAKVVAGHALDAGPLASARTLEGLTAVIVNLNPRYRAHAGIAVTGIPDPGSRSFRSRAFPRSATETTSARSSPPQPSSKTETPSSSRRRPYRKPKAVSSPSMPSSPPTALGPSPARTPTSAGS